MNIHRLRPEEAIQVDLRAFHEIQASVGQSRGNYVIDLIMNELLEALVLAEEAMAGGDMTALRRAVVGVLRQAGRLQLRELSAQAAAVADLCRDGVDVSLPAVVHRMTRTGEATVAAVWRAMAHLAHP